MPCRPPPTPEQLREAIRDLTGILRAMYLAGRRDDSPRRSAAIVDAGKRLAELSALVEQPGTEAYDMAMRAADTAIKELFGSLHFNSSLEPVLGFAVERVLASRQR